MAGHVLSVINSNYCVRCHQNLQINTEKRAAYNEANNLLFSLTRETNFRVMLDRESNPIVTLERMTPSFLGRWNVYRGQGRDPAQLLFKVKLSSTSIMRGTQSKLEVFLENNNRVEDRNRCDFRVIIDGNKRSCTVYAGESPNFIAQMENRMGFTVRINPYVDYAFIVTLLMIDCQRDGF
ncbi:hypothetical protein Fmac_025455 [Flemingia macrophylla]|uniref:Uncharacterized protein n=1 Tax=Flemingia macrophylla TaxID=520843 RepID=A0ABD1LS92_9FABA